MKMNPQLSSHSLTMPVVLIGMMGSGKTHFGRLLSSALDLPFHDSDNLIEKKAGCSVSEIFERWGEGKFREAEANTIQDYIAQGPSVLATGGGAILNAQTAEVVFSQSISIWIDAPLDVILERVSRNKNRPLLACENPREVLQQLMEARAPIYERARIHIKVGEENTERTLEKILDAIQKQLALEG